MDQPHDTKKQESATAFAFAFAFALRLLLVMDLRNIAPTPETSPINMRKIQAVYSNPSA